MQWHTDKQNCVNIVHKGSTKANLQSLAFSIFSKCVEFSISLNIVWIPREDNTKADYLSNVIDYDDWQTTNDFFFNLSIVFGDHIL